MRPLSIIYIASVFSQWTVCLIMEKAMAPHSSTLAWKIPWMEEHGRLQSMGSLRVRHDWVTSLSLFTWRRKWQPTPVFLPGESRGSGAWWAAVYGVAQSQTRLKRLSSSSSNDVQSFSYNTKLESIRKVIVELVKVLTEVRIHWIIFLR